MPEGWQLYACLFPARFFTGFCRAVMLRGADITECWQDALALFVYCVGIFSVSALSVKKNKIM